MVSTILFLILLSTLIIFVVKVLCEIVCESQISLQIEEAVYFQSFKDCKYDSTLIRIEPGTYEVVEGEHPRKIVKEKVWFLKYPCDTFLTRDQAKRLQMEGKLKIIERNKL